MKNIYKSFLVLVFTITISFCENITFVPSFDCSNIAKLNEIEKVICNNQALSKLDIEMNEAYKQILSVSDEFERKNIIAEQRRWLRYRNKLDKENCHNLNLCIQTTYYSRLFYLRPDKFHLMYKKDNSTCNAFLDILKNDLEKNKDINLERINEFSSIKWTNIQDEPKDKISITYFDINNDGIDEAVFKREGVYQYYDVVNIYYTSKDSGVYIENYTSNETTFLSKYQAILDKQIAQVNNGFGVFNELLVEGDIEVRFVDTIDPVQYPIKINDTYYMAIFGTAESWSERQTLPLEEMPKYANKITLIKFDKTNTPSTVCSILRPNQNIIKYIIY